VWEPRDKLAETVHGPNRLKRLSDPENRTFTTTWCIETASDFECG
jgi:hypothetical protein